MRLIRTKDAWQVTKAVRRFTPGSSHRTRYVICKDELYVFVVVSDVAKFGRVTYDI